jgi:transcriptional regulator with XRE-family HTH domain
VLQYRMTSSIYELTPTHTHTLPATLQRARKAKRLSQLELSLQLAVSQRHVSFVESGRAKPSRELLTAWLQALDAPLVLRNAAMLQAGYAPLFGESTLTDPQLAPVNDALIALLQSHNPQPAFLMDADWNVLHVNRGGLWLAKTLVPWADLPVTAEGRVTDTVNMLDLLSHPEGFAKSLINLSEVGPALLALLRDHSANQLRLRPRVETFASLLRARLSEQMSPAGANKAMQMQWPQQAPPVLTSRFATPYGELGFFSMFTTFGTPQDITLASLRVEHMFAADEATRVVLTAQVPR